MEIRGTRPRLGYTWGAGAPAAAPPFPRGLPSYSVRCLLLSSSGLHSAFQWPLIVGGRGGARP